MAYFSSEKRSSGCYQIYSHPARHIEYCLQQAVFDAFVETDSILKGLSEAFGMSITRTTTPEIFTLMERVENDGSQSVRSAKKKYARKRPYVQFNEPTGVPHEEEALRHKGSFPSGHTARGWAMS